MCFALHCEVFLFLLCQHVLDIHVRPLCSCLLQCFAVHLYISHFAAFLHLTVLLLYCCLCEHPLDGRVRPEFAEFSSNQLWQNSLKVSGVLLSCLKTLICWFRCDYLWLEWNSEGQWPFRNRTPIHSWPLCLHLVFFAASHKVLK